MQACPFLSGVQFKGIFQIVCSRAHGGPFIIKSAQGGEFVIEEFNIFYHFKKQQQNRNKL